MVRTNFFYRYGEVSTIKPWNPPNQKIFDLWWDEFSSCVDLEEYKVYLGGSFVIKPEESMDIDIMFTGPVLNYRKLYQKFKYGLDLAINKYNIYVDLCWWDNIDFCQYPREKDFFRYHNLLKMGGQEYKIVNDVCSLDRFHKSTDVNLQIPNFLSFNRVILPMEKQRFPKYKFTPIRLN
jgi:hypothetical protein